MTKADITYDGIKAVIEKKGYKFFTGEGNVNMIGIRSNMRKVNNWDDFFVLAWEEQGEKRVWVNDEFTTDPGIYYMQKKFLNPKGCGILAPGQYRGVWKIGLHLGKYKAFLQLGNKVKAYRDRNRDNYLDFDPDTIQEDYFGANQHHGYGTKNVDNNSAMCQVHRYPADLNYVLSIAEKSIPRWGDTFTYTLLEEADFSNK